MIILETQEFDKKGQERVSGHIPIGCLRANWCMICLSCELELCGNQSHFLWVLAEFFAPHGICSHFLNMGRKPLIQTLCLHANSSTAVLTFLVSDPGIMQHEDGNTQIL